MGGINVHETVTGLSPRLRGNQGAIIEEWVSGGSIPAPAGEPDVLTARADGDGVYPRACGGTQVWFDSVSAWAGLSPRLRGNRGRMTEVNTRLGSIPAPAGEPPSRAPCLLI